MAGIKDYSTTAADNNSAPPNGAPEGMLPSTVNNTLRQIMADTRSWYEDAEWRDFGDTCTYASGTSFTVSADLTARYVANRRVRAVGSSTGTIYGTISSSSYSDPTTTVNVTWDSGSLSNETLAVSLGVTPANKAIPAAAISGSFSSLSVSSGTSGDATVTIVSDTDNNDETDHPSLRLKQDGGGVDIRFGIGANDADSGAWGNFPVITVVAGAGSEKLGFSTDNGVTVEEVYHTGNTVAVADGGTGASTAALARVNLGVAVTPEELITSYIVVAGNGTTLNSKGSDISASRTGTGSYTVPHKARSQKHAPIVQALSTAHVATVSDNATTDEYTVRTYNITTGSLSDSDFVVIETEISQA